jgi:hypothetical protein
MKHRPARLHPFGQHAQDQRGPLVVGAHHPQRHLGVGRAFGLFPQKAHGADHNLGQHRKAVEERLDFLRFQRVEGMRGGAGVVADAQVLAFRRQRVRIAGGQHDHRIAFGREAMGGGAGDIRAGAQDEGGTFLGHRASLFERSEAK